MPGDPDQFTLHILLKEVRVRLDKAESLSHIAAIMACADTRRQNAMSSMVGLLPALLAVAAVAEPDADEPADVALTATGAAADVDVDVGAAEVAVADKHPPTLRESPTTETTATPSRFSPQRRSTTTTLSSTLMQSMPLAGQMGITRVPMTAYPTMTLVTTTS